MCGGTPSCQLFTHGEQIKGCGKVKKPHHSCTEKEVASVASYIAYRSSFTLNKNTLKHQVICGGFPNSNTETRKSRGPLHTDDTVPRESKSPAVPRPAM